MSGGTDRERERIRHLMMAALDDELDVNQRAELERILSHDAELRAEWERLVRLKEATKSMMLRRPPEEMWSHYWASVYNRFERGIGWTLVSLGAVVLVSWGIWEFLGSLFADTELPFYIKLSILAVVAGLTILTFSVFREKLFTRARDPYREVER
jgi:ferric-dicitrate binding protein FerR (iron transport regulator)